MVNPYTEVSITGYNAGPPSDDGQQVEANEVEWQKHLDKIGGPLKTAVEATQTNVTAAFAKRFFNGTVTTSSNLTITTAQDGKLIEGNGTITLTLPSASTAGEGFKVGLANTGTGTVTVDPDGSETINAFTTFALSPQQWLLITSDGTNWSIGGGGFLDGSPLARGYIDGLNLSNDATDTDHDIEIAAGECRDTDNAANITLSTAITKQIDNNWVEGDDLGGFPSGLTLSASTTYHAFVISKTDATTDAGYDTSLTATNLLADATGYTRYRRVGSVVTDSSSNIRSFFQIGDEFFLSVPPRDVSTTNPGTSAVTATLTVPTGVEVMARIAFLYSDSSSVADEYILVTSLDQADTAPSAMAFDGHIVNTAGNDSAQNSKPVKTNTSRQIRYRVSHSNASVLVRLMTHSWVDQRGKNG